MMDWEERERIRQAWLDFLGRWKWQVFYTLTFADPVSPRLAIDRTKRWLNAVVNYYGDSITKAIGFVVAERFRVTPSFHSHGLLCTSPVSFFDLQDSLRFSWLLAREMFESRSRVESIRCIGDVQGYVAKYLTKSWGEVDYDLFVWEFDKVPVLL